MSHNVRFRNNNRRSQQKNKNVQGSATPDEQNPVIKAFQEYAHELDDKHDRYEKLVKLSRDITIESKRIIFLLHTIDARKNNRDRVMQEANERLNKIIETNFKSVALELVGHDRYQYRSAYSPGLQEFIEAYSFMEYFKSGGDETVGTISDWNALQQKMQYERPEKDDIQTDNVSGVTEEDAIYEEQPNAMAAEVKKSQIVEFVVDPTEYILGISDLTGELMRRCINSLGSGETEVCLETCKVLQQFFTGFISLNLRRFRELSRKIHTMRQSVLKAENVCYNVKVRGGEAAKWGAVFENKVTEDVDEGFY